VYISATGAQVKNQFLSSLNRFRARPAFAGWNWLEAEVRTPQGGFLFGRATDTGGHIEGIHDHPESPAGLLVDECKSIADGRARRTRTVSYQVPALREFDRTRFRRVLSDHDGEGSSVENVPCYFVSVSARKSGRDCSGPVESERQRFPDQARCRISVRCW
jgi:hypothetical protein